MEDFITQHRSEFFWTMVTFIVVILSKFVLSKTVRRVGKLGEFNQVRTNLIIKYISFSLTVTGLAILTLIWGVNFKDLGVLLSSVFAVIGVALFAQWSMLSNITAGVIIFFSYPFKIGNTIRIMDKEISDTEDLRDNVFVIEDIRAFHLHLRKKNGEILTYPNNLVLQKGVALIATYNEEVPDEIDDTEVSPYED